MRSFIDDIAIHQPPFIQSGVFSHYPKAKENLDKPHFRAFKQSEERKTLVSKREVDFSAHERYLKELSDYDNLWSVFSGEASKRSAESNSLVITRKSPTAICAVNSRETALRIYHREWSGEYRVSVESFTRLQKPPPSQSGERITSKLTQNAASKIKDAGAYVATTKSGFTTFCTLTFDTAMRRRIEREETTIGKEVSRFMDGIQKKITRGWTWTPPGSELNLSAAHRIEGRDKKLNYIWVAENPDKKIIATAQNGEEYQTVNGTNPHVHFLMDWSVERDLFDDWAQQLEALWGNGYAKLEKIRNPHSATGYLLKALGYMTKGAQNIDKDTGEIFNSQGSVKGNRYGISKEARAPDWECISEYQAQHMGQVVREVGQRICLESDAIRARLKHEQNQIDKQKAEIAKCSNKNYAAKIPHQIISDRLKVANVAVKQNNARQRALSDMTRKMDYSNKFKITFRSKSSLNKFIEYSILKHGWCAKLLEHTTSNALKEAKQISVWAGKQAKDVMKKVKDASENLERYWTAVLSDSRHNQLSEIY